MKSVEVVALLFVGIVLKSTVDGLDVKCKGIDVKVTEEHMMTFKDCMKMVGVEKLTDLNPGNAGCFSKCAMEKQSLVDAAGKPHKENIMKAIDANLPAELIEPWKTAMTKCLDNEGMQIKSPDDASCSSYMPLVMCTHMAFLNVCK